MIVSALSAVRKGNSFGHMCFLVRVYMFAFILYFHLFGRLFVLSYICSFNNFLLIPSFIYFILEHFLVYFFLFLTLIAQSSFQS